MWLNAPNKSGLTIPWEYNRHLIARRLGFRVPYEMDEIPHREIEQELRMLELEDAAKQRRQGMQGGIQS